MIGGALLLAIGVRRRLADPAFGTLSRLGAWLTLAGGALTALTGDHLGKVITQVQPMKMAAAEALYVTTTGAPFSLFAVPGYALKVPDLLFGPGSYIPMVPVAFWAFRLMIGVGMLAALIAAVYLWTSRKGRTPPRLLLRFLPLIPLLPAAANSIGWIFTETARQPWLAFGLTKVADGISPGLTSSEVLASLLGFAVIYGLLAVAWLRLIRHLSRQPLSPPSSSPSPTPVEVRY
jgi:cytochrome d ubiquinol oxidase subunit I